MSMELDVIGPLWGENAAASASLWTGHSFHP